MWWPFGKKESNIDEVKKSVEISFLNVKKDIEMLKETIKNLESKKDDHHAKIALLLDKFDRLDKDIKFEASFEKGPELTNIGGISNTTLKLFDSLTDKQKAVCRIIAALNLETPDKWISLKTISEELHPNSNYNKVRSNISEYTTLLEELGFIKKKKRGRQSYITSTNSNPCLIELQQINKLAKASKKKQDKKSKQ